MNNQTEKKKINWFRTIRPIALLLVLVTLLTYATYSWMKRDWTPEVHQENIKIVAGSSLVFLFNENAMTESSSITDLVDGFEDFVFKSVSNSTGKSDDFFALKYSARGKYFDEYKKIKVSEIEDAEIKDEYKDPEQTQDDVYDTRMNYTLLGKNHGYIELTFAVKALEGTKTKVKLDENSYIRAAANAKDDTKAQTAVAAMRVSITVPDATSNDGTKTILFVPTVDGTPAGSVHSHEGVSTDTKDRTPVYLTKEYDTEENYEEVRPGVPKLRKDVDKNLVRNANDDLRGLPDADQNYDLFTLNSEGNPEQIIVRIWLEGEDVDCTDEKILGGELDILIKFAAEEV